MKSFCNMMSRAHLAILPFPQDSEIIGSHNKVSPSPARPTCRTSVLEQNYFLQA